MWVEERSNGKFKFCERYTDYLTGKVKRVSVIMDKNTAQTRKIAQRTLEQKIQDGDSNHAYADRHRGYLPERAFPVPEQGQGNADAESKIVYAETPGAGR